MIFLPTHFWHIGLQINDDRNEMPHDPAIKEFVWQQVEIVVANIEHSAGLLFNCDISRNSISLAGLATASAQSKSDREMEDFACKDVMHGPNSA